MNATHRVTRFSSVINLLKQFTGNLQLDTSQCNEAHGDKTNVVRWKLVRSFPRNFLVMSEFISQSYIYVSWCSPLAPSLRNLRRASLDRIEAYADKGNIINSKLGKRCLRFFFLICEFISQTYNLNLRKQFAITLFVESLKWYLGAHRGPMVKKGISSHNN